VIDLVLPYPLSANRYWRPVKVGKHITIVPTKEAKAYRADVAARCPRHSMVTGRVAIFVWLYPNRPQDWQKRQRLHGAAWDDTVLCIDLDNANKVLLDSLKGIAFEDDAWVRRLVSQRMEPDDEGERVVVRIEQMRVAQPQLALMGEVA
jgi:crossover junction endodeoxyribonuclease RusA